MTIRVIDLTSSSGLPIHLHDELPPSGPLQAKGIRLPKPDVRRAIDMGGLWHGEGSKAPEDLYWMYRDVFRPEDEAAIRNLGVRFDLTVLRPGTVDGEWIKTAGHYHPLVPGHELTYPELYGVLHGEAIFLLQHSTLPGDHRRAALDEAFLIEAHQGEMVCIPPDYGHITINYGECPLVLANWVADHFSSIYEPIRNASGGAFFVLKGQRMEITKNASAPETLAHPHLQRAVPLPDWGIEFHQPFYDLLSRKPDLLRLLIHPQEGRDLWRAVRFQMQQSG